MVFMTLDPSATAPPNSVIGDSIPTSSMVSVRAATDAEYEFATSFAPLPRAPIPKEMAVSAKI